MGTDTGATQSSPAGKADRPDARNKEKRYISSQTDEINRQFAAAALVDLIACTAIRPGSEAYVRERGTRGAATLLKKHVQITGDEIALRFPGKGGKQVEKVCKSNRLVKTISDSRNCLAIAFFNIYRRMDPFDVCEGETRMHLFARSPTIKLA